MEVWEWAAVVLEKRILILIGSRTWGTASAVESEGILLEIVWNARAIVSAFLSRSWMLILTDGQIPRAAAKATASERNHRDTAAPCLDFCSGRRRAATAAWGAESRVDRRPAHRES